MRAGSWLLLCAVHGVASMLGWWLQEPWIASLVWRSDAWLAQPWSLWTSAWVHVNTPHLIANQLALGLLVAFAWAVRPDGWSTLAWFLAWPLSQAVLPWWPQIGYATGLAGVLHAALAVLAVHLCLGRLAVYRPRRWGALLALGLVAKLLLERGWQLPVVWDAAADMSVVRAAMLAGALWGTVLGLLTAGAARFLRRWQAA